MKCATVVHYFEITYFTNCFIIYSTHLCFDN